MHALLNQKRMLYIYIYIPKFFYVLLYDFSLREAFLEL